jgi:hypothetical protein
MDFEALFRQWLNRQSTLCLFLWGQPRAASNIPIEKILEALDQRVTINPN